MKTRITIITLASIIISACSSIKITSDYDSSVDFTKFKTYSFYGWADNSQVLLSNFDQKRFEKSFSDEFKRRGLSQVHTDGDIVVSFYIVTDTKTSRTSYTTHYSTGGYGYPSAWGWGLGHSTTSYHDYDYLVGTFICDIFDANSKELIWQGVAAGEIDQNVSSNRDRVIPRTVASILTRYPIPPMKK